MQGLGDAKDIIIDGNNENSIILITTKSTVSLNNITFINGKSDTYGGAVYTETARSVHVRNCVFENNTALKDGGALQISSKFNPNPREFFYGYLEIDNCSFISNYAEFSGGAVGTYYVDADINNSEFFRNYAGDFAGALSFVNGKFSVSKSKFENNYADYDGGVIRQNMDSTLTITDSQFINNTAKEWGGALYNWLGNLTVKNCTLTNNTAGIRGGGIFTGGPLTVTSSQVTDNNAEHGGAIYVFQEFYKIEPIVTFNNNTVTGNTASKGSVVYYFLLTYTPSDYENNYWGDINPNSTEWASAFVTNEYTDFAPKTWIEKPLQDTAENTTSKNESKAENTPKQINKNNVEHKTKNITGTNLKSEIKKQNDLKMKAKGIDGFASKTSAANTTANPGADNRAQKVSEITPVKQVSSSSDANLFLIIIFLAILDYAVYRYKK